MKQNTIKSPFNSKPTFPLIVLLVLFVTSFPNSSQAQIKIINNPVAKPTGSDTKFVHPNAPILPEMGPYITYELRDYRFPIRLSNQVNAHITAENLPHGAKIMIHGSLQTNNLRYDFEWTPEWDDAGLYELTIIASNEYGESRRTVQLYVFNSRSPHVSLNHVHMKVMREGNMMRYYILPIIDSDGEIALPQIEMRIASDSEEITWNGNNSIVNWEEVRQVNNEFWGYNVAWVFDIPLTLDRKSIPFTLSLQATTAGGEVWEQQIEFGVGNGELSDDVYGNNSSVFVFKHKYLPALSILGFAAGYDNAIDGQRWGLSGEIAAVGDFDGDRYDDFIFAEPGKISYAISELDSGNGTLWVNHVYKKREVVGAGDFNGDGVDQLVVINRRTQEIEKWPFDMDRIERGWVDSWPIPAGYEVLKIEDFDGDHRSDILWNDTANGRLVLWKQGEAWDREVTLGNWTGRERILSFVNVNGASGCDILYYFNGDNRLHVGGFKQKQWIQGAVQEMNMEDWEMLTTVNVRGGNYSYLLIRNRLERQEFRYVVIDEASQGSSLSTHLEVEASLEFETAIDFNGDGKDDLVFSERRFDPSIQRDKKYYTVLLMDFTTPTDIIEFELPVEWEMQNF